MPATGTAEVAQAPAGGPPRGADPAVPGHSATPAVTGKPFQVQTVRDKTVRDKTAGGGTAATAGTETHAGRLPRREPAGHPPGRPPGVTLRLPALTGLRGVAACLVFARHIFPHVEQVIPGLAVVGNIGYTGVTFFFVLSGFVLAWATRPSAGREFYWQRFARVYPLYFVAVWIWLGVAWSFDMLGDFGAKTIAIIPSLLLVQAWVPDQSIYFGWGGAVLWSMSCEAFFYLAFPFVYRLLAVRSNVGRMRAAVGLVVPTAAVACAASLAGSRFDLAAFANPGLRIAEFVLGVALGLTARAGARGTRGQRRLLAGSASAWLAVPVVLGFSHGHMQGLIDTLTLPAFAVIIFLAGTHEADGGRVKIASVRPLVYLGELSYAFYLLHPVPLTIAVRLGWFDVGTVREAVLAVLGCLASSLALAAVLHHTVEQPARRHLVRLSRSRPSRGRHACRRLPDVGWQIPSQRQP